MSETLEFESISDMWDWFINLPENLPGGHVDGKPSVIGLEIKLFADGSGSVRNPFHFSATPALYEFEIHILTRKEREIKEKRKPNVCPDSYDERVWHVYREINGESFYSESSARSRARQLYGYSKIGSFPSAKSIPAEVLAQDVTNQRYSHNDERIKKAFSKGFLSLMEGVASDENPYGQTLTGATPHRRSLINAWRAGRVYCDALGEK